MSNALILKERALTIINESKTVLEQLNKFEDWNSLIDIISNIKTLTKFSYNLVSIIEISVDDMANELTDLQSEDKLDAAVFILDDALKLGWAAEIVDGMIIKIIIKYAVDTLNNLLGNDWNIDRIKQALKDGKDFITTISTNLGTTV